MTAEATPIPRNVLVAASLLLAAATATADGLMTPEYAHGDYRPKTMVLLPPQATVTKKKVASSEQMIEEGSRLEDAAALELRKRFHDFGYDVRILGVAEVNADPGLQAMIRGLNERYDEATSHFRLNFMGGLNGKDVRERRFKLGDTARVVAARLGADALAICRISAEGATGGQKAMAALFGSSMGYVTLQLGIVAGDNGDLEAYFYGFDGNMSPVKLAEQPVAVIADIADRALKSLPAADGPGRYKKRWLQDSHREVPPSAAGNEADLSELEALFGETPADEGTEDAGEAAAESLREVEEPD
jgi:hypothetical protein